MPPTPEQSPVNKEEAYAELAEQHKARIANFTAFLDEENWKQGVKVASYENLKKNVEALLDRTSEVIALFGDDEMELAKEMFDSSLRTEQRVYHIMTLNLLLQTLDKLGSLERRLDELEKRV